MFPPSIQKLIDIFSEFPTVGPRTAGRFVLYLLKLPKEELENLSSSIIKLKEKVKLCKFCFLPFEDEADLCPICRDKARDKNILCIVEKESDVDSIENIKKYKGLYFVLGGTISLLKKEKSIRINELMERINGFKEIIIAVNPTTEGEITALYLERMLKKTCLDSPSSARRVTRLGRGLPKGGELEYADEETLSSAFENRK